MLSSLFCFSSFLLLYRFVCLFVCFSTLCQYCYMSTFNLCFLLITWFSCTGFVFRWTENSDGSLYWGSALGGIIVIILICLAISVWWVSQTYIHSEGMDEYVICQFCSFLHQQIPHICIFVLIKVVDSQTPKREWKYDPSCCSDAHP